MKRKACNCLCLLLTVLFSLSLILPAAAADAQSNTLHLRTPEDLRAFSQRCTLDSWSQGKTVYLDADIDLAGASFSPIPTFGGVFQGQGHTISGLSITGSGNIRGLFRYIQPSGQVYDLTVQGSVDPSGRKNHLGGLAGDNRGKLVNCSVSVNISGTDSVGGLVGINQAEGQIINCSFTGSVAAEHYAGGIAGQNYGAVIQCENSGSINTTVVDTPINLDDLNREQLNAAENVPVCTDIGGIAGFSTGVLQGCNNAGAVGYAHVGYNIGGIAGRLSGYLDGCTNSGVILGRKDVGGIAGQLEPEVRLLYDQGTMGELTDALDELQQLLNQTGEDLRGSSAALSARLDAISNRAGEAQAAIGDLAHSVTGWTNTTIDQIDNVTARISWLIDQLAPILENTAGTMGLAEELAGQLDEVLDEISTTAGLGEEASQELRAAIQTLQQSAASGKEAAANLSAALEHLRKVLGSDSQSSEAAQAVQEAVRALNTALEETAGALNTLTSLLWNGGDQESLGTAVRALADTLKQSGITLEHAIDAMAAYLIHPEELDAARQAAAAALANLRIAAQSLETAASQAAQATSLLPELSAQLTSLTEALRIPCKTLEELAAQAASTGRELADVFLTLSDMPAITIPPIDSTIVAQGDALGDIFSGLLDDANALKTTLSNSTDSLLDDLQAITDQFGVITGLLRTMLNTSEGPQKDWFEDVSDEEAGTTATGTVTHAHNTGAVEGNINVSGIVGSMAIEYDFDPEDDLLREGERSMDFRYQTRAVVVSCVNTGTITGKQDYAGGIVGRMDLGRVSRCENYGTVISTDGDYVGGVAGAAWGSLRDCWSKCHLSGGDYIGGVAGLGVTLTNCHTLVCIDAGAAYLGAVAGGLESGGTVSGNTFTSNVLGAVDGISYAGQAEPVEFDALCATAGVPDSFPHLELTFVADGVTVAVIPFQYGDSLETLPEIPAKEGYSAAWPALDYTCLTASQTLEAVYTPYTSALTDGGALPEILVDGSFSSEAAVTHTSQAVNWTDESATRHTATAYTVTVQDPNLHQISYTVHYRLPDPGRHYTLWVREGERWTQAEYEIDGQYLLLRSQTDTITFCVTQDSDGLWIWITAGAASLLLIGVVVTGFVRRKNKRRRAH